MDLSERGASARRHPWELVRGEFFSSLVRQYGGSARRVLDIGAGDSWFGSELGRQARHDEIVCWDTAYSPADLADPPAGVTRTGTPPEGTFDLVLMLDVLEHIEDPPGFLEAEVRPRLASGAVVIASVPAHPRLYGAHDTALGHYRRYVPAEFVGEIDALCPVVESGPLFISLLLPRAAQLLASRARAGSGEGSGVGHWSHGTAVTAAVRGALTADARICRLCALRNIPIRGLSHWAVAINEDVI